MSSLSIITTCKGRLGHLQESLPTFIAQDCEVVVVDYDCPEDTAGFVRQHFPAVKVVGLANRPYFNNWEARNAGATAATRELLAFVDADTMLADGFSAWAISNVREGSYAKMPNALQLKTHGDAKVRAGSNRLEGLLVIPRPAFDRLSGYDDLLEGWGAGGDIDMVDRLEFHQSTQLTIPEYLVSRAIAHSDEDRVRFHQTSISTSHMIGVLYRTSKNSLMRLFNKDVARDDRARLYAMAKAAAMRPRSQNMTQIEMAVLSNQDPHSNYKVEQFVTTRITWFDRQ